MTLTHNSYKVGWICALPIEMAAAKCLLDETHPPLPQPPTDTNSYALGRIASHNVVIACLPSGVYGTTSAAHVARQMIITFPSLHFGLMVGIGGGVPITAQPAADIRLGDVVVSIPLGPSPGVITYDRGKSIEGGKFLRTGSLNRPPQVLLTAVSNLRSSYILGRGRIGEIVDRLVAEYPSFRSPGPENDRLFDTSLGLSANEAPEAVERPPRLSDIPQVHYGTIASGDSLLKHGKTRDRLAAELDILCFEMEAAGMMDLDHFPCLVIRGVSDYADESKNKEWQPYAAAAAAAYTKELLDIVPKDHSQGLSEHKPITTSDSQPLDMSSMTSSLPSSLLYQMFPVEENFLGSLTTDNLWPRQNFHALPTLPIESQIIVSLQTRPHKISVSTTARSSFFSGATSKAHSSSGSNGNSDDADRTNIAVDRSSSCMLKNSNDWFESMCAQRRTRQWLEKQLIRSKQRIYLVVGFRSLFHRDIALSPACQKEESSSSRPLPCLGELVFAVQYRQLKFEWFRRTDVDSARLQKGNCWQSLYTDRGDDDDEDEVENYLEVMLDGDVAEAAGTA